MANNFATSIQGLLIDFLKPLEEAGSDPGKLTEWLATLGFGPGISSDPALTPIVQRAAALVAKVKALDAQTLQSWTGIASILSSGQDVATILQALRDFAADPARKDVTAGLAEELMSYLLASYLRRQHPTAFRVASLLTLIESRETAPVDPAIVTGGTTVRMARVLDRFKFGSVDDLITRPGATLEAFYFPNGLAAGADAWLSAERLFPNLGFLADLLGSSWRTEYRSDTAGSASTEGVIDPEESVVFDQDVSGDAPVPAPGPAAPDTFFASRRPTFSIKPAQEADLAIEISPSSHQHASAIAGLIVSLGGSFNHIETRGPWKLTFSASGEIPVLALGPDGVSRVPTGSPGTGGSTKLVIERIPDEGTSGAAFILGSPQGTRVEFGNLQAAFSLSADAQSADGSIDVAATSGMLCLAPSDGDGFLGSILPAAGLQAKFDLGLSWSGRRGLTLRGGAGLDTTVPVGFSIGGVSMPSVHLGLQAKDGSVSAEASASLSASIGPVRAVLDRLGIAGTLSFPQNGGNLGLADLQVGFKPPSGVGLSVEASGVLTGGGFLFHDEAQGIYAGVMQLSLHEQITLKAFGLIGTRMPDGSRGYSLVIFITAEDFRPVPLGMGFTLQGIGGMVAVHRTFDQNVLREGLKSDTLSALLFPRDPVGNAPAIIQALNSAFPARRGSYLLGLLARIGWFTPTLIQMDLALILEFGARERLLVLGRISSLLPSADNDLVRLNLDAMGVLDFDEGTAAIDAVLVDSRLVHKFALTGAMALRARWTSGPGSGFVLAVGGFNPRFAPPAGVPAAGPCGHRPQLGQQPAADLRGVLRTHLQHRAVWRARPALRRGLWVQPQWGCRLRRAVPDRPAALHRRLPGLGAVEARLEQPVQGVGARRARRSTAAAGERQGLLRDPVVRLLGALRQDPDRRRAAAAARGGGRARRAQERAVHCPELEHAAAGATHPRGGPAQPGAQPGAGARSARSAGGQAAGSAAQQRARHRHLRGRAGGRARRFALAAAVNGKPLQQSEVLRADFAPAQFFAMSDDEKLASPSFEQMDAGLVFGSDAVSYDATQLVAAPLQYEAIVIDTALAAGAPLPAAQPYTLPAQRLGLHALSGAAARAPVRRVGRARFMVAKAQPAVSLTAARWNIVPLDGGAALALDPKVRTWSEYRGVLNTLNRAGARWQVVPAAEAA